jgi:hypothetical protein
MSQYKSIPDTILTSVWMEKMTEGLKSLENITRMLIENTGRLNKRLDALEKREKERDN